jgi:two-component system response regulator NreC
VSSSLPSPSVTILVVDDHGVVRDGLTVLLQRHHQLQVVGAVGTGTVAVDAAVRLKPNVIVMDLVLPQLDSIDAMERILRRLPQTRVVILSACHSSEHILRALRAGASAYVSKEAAAEELVRAVNALILGDRYLSSHVTTMALDGLVNNCASQSPIERLSARERQVLHLTVGGSSSADIATKLSLSRKTVDTHRGRVMKKLHLSDRSQLIHFAIEHALTPTYSL